MAHWRGDPVRGVLLGCLAGRCTPTAQEHVPAGLLAVSTPQSCPWELGKALQNGSCWEAGCAAGPSRSHGSHRAVKDCSTLQAVSVPRARWSAVPAALVAAMLVCGRDCCILASAGNQLAACLHLRPHVVPAGTAVGLQVATR